MDFIITPVSLAKPGPQALSDREQAANLAVRNFELAQELDVARAKLAEAETAQVIWAQVAERLGDRVGRLEFLAEMQALTIQELDLFATALEVAVYGSGRSRVVRI
ncbi:hypothetical protein [Kitasatospora sp. NPDC059800]|uniref:hypothetical protein n=1 Tax=Kitasatospora sp. NPDC059800 TaxID=3346951 RepID=UPI0036666EBE